MTAKKPLWTPTAEQIAASPLTAFKAEAEKRTGRNFANYGQLHSWSVTEPEAFWDLVWDFCGVIGEKGSIVLRHGDKMPGAAFFPEARLNYAENLLGNAGKGDAIIFRGENKVERRLGWAELEAQVSKLQQLFLSLGLKAGDRVAAMMPNMPEAVTAMLAVTSIGAVWSSCSPDFGEQGVLDRFGQIEPVIFIAPDGYWYNGKAIETGPKTAMVAARLPTLKKVLIVDYLGTAREVAAPIPGAEAFEDAIQPFTPTKIAYAQLPFSHPSFILFSSGTTGIPKCIVHSAGGTLLQLLKEHRLHAGLEAGDPFFYFTTCGWMMWNWLVNGLASGATLLLYDGSPFYPDGNALFDYAQAEKMTHFGTSAKFIDSVRKAGLRPIDSHDLSALRSISSTGSPLSPQDFRFVYDGIGHDLHLASISGGTDIVSCFVLGVPTEPVWEGEIQGAGLGMAVDVWNDEGRPVREEKGELVCTRPFPSMPVSFWNDPDGAKYRAAYFEGFANTWCHGDFAEWTVHGGIIIHGRSDATLNPGGVRIGTAEIYNQVEQMPEIIEALCIGQDFDDDVRVVLFVRLAQGVSLTQELEKEIRTRIRTGASPRHVPARIVAVSDIPRTRSGKISELAVRDTVHGRTVKNKEALANPEALDLFVELRASLMES
ncbi:acetoacetate--CoA ligase [Aquamicrobium segne]|uniref:Acetoacetate--CoA ligase n=1 Tax=Aquamicrobium segne TaxID=469547 RepID=A0ABW0GY89_9HYPH